VIIRLKEKAIGTPLFMYV